ncbi:MAG: glycosyltransferase [Prevotellaceae bacterium]|nr:glycosyltransferase [Prevotellaceae bacterium]
MMKIMHIGQRIGGLDIYIKNVIEYADANFFDFVVVQGKKDKTEPISKNGKLIKTYAVDMYRSIGIKDIACLLQILKIVRREQPALIHCHSAKGGIMGRTAGLLTRTKTLYTPHAYSFLSTRSRLKRTVYIFLEKLTKFNASQLACSNSEQVIGEQLIGYKKEKSFVWTNAVPDISKLLKNV